MQMGIESEIIITIFNTYFEVETFLEIVQGEHWPRQINTNSQRYDEGQLYDADAPGTVDNS